MEIGNDYYILRDGKKVLFGTFMGREDVFGKSCLDMFLIEGECKGWKYIATREIEIGREDEDVIELRTGTGCSTILSWESGGRLLQSGYLERVAKLKQLKTGAVA